jgi:hypothetical protein
MSRPDPVCSDGLPFVLDGFRLDSRIADADDLDTIFDGSPAPMQPGSPPTTKVTSCHWNSM